MKKTFSIACFLIGLATLFPPTMLLSNVKWGFLFALPHVAIFGSDRILYGTINWPILLAEYILIITFSISVYYGRKLFPEKKAKNGSKTPPEATKKPFDPIAFVNELIAKPGEPEDARTRKILETSTLFKHAKKAAGERSGDNYTREHKGPRPGNPKQPGIETKE